MTPATTRTQRTQGGAIAILVAFTVVALVLMIGLVLDLGQLYVGKSELQNAADACALGAARELNDLGAGALDRATAAGVTVGNRNRTDLQKDPVEIRVGDVAFAETLSGPFTRTITPTTVYVRCAPHESNPKSFTLRFMRLAGLTQWELSAEAIARPMPSQSFCVMPIAMCTTALPGTPNLGFQVGTWYSGRLSAGNATQGNYDWLRFPGMSGAADLADIIAGSGSCETPPTLVDSQPGVVNGVAQAWNTRFGLYSGRFNDINAYPPDRSGFAYTPNRSDQKGNTIPGSWPYGNNNPNPPPAMLNQNAYSRTVNNSNIADEYARTHNYQYQKNTAHDPYNPTALIGQNGKPLILPGNPSPLSSALHASKGQDRRMVMVPVIGCQNWAPNKKNMPVLDYACAFMLSPIDDPGTDVQLEFRGLASQGACGSTGFPGTFGPPVPALVK